LSTSHHQATGRHRHVPTSSAAGDVINDAILAKDKPARLQKTTTTALNTSKPNTLPTPTNRDVINIMVGEIPLQ
jgi:hypothetical protein